MTDQRPAPRDLREEGQLDPYAGNPDDPMVIADFEGEAEFMAEQDEERRRNGPTRTPLWSEVPPPD